MRPAASRDLRPRVTRASVRRTSVRAPTSPRAGDPLPDTSNPRRRLFLPLLDSVRHGTRSHATCYYKCGNACDAAVPNRTDNPTFESVVQTALSRRALLKAAGAGALVVAAGPLFPGPAAAAPGRGGAARDGALTFEPVE